MTVALGALQVPAREPSVRRLDGSLISPAEIDRTVVRLMQAAEVCGVGISLQPREDRFLLHAEHCLTYHNEGAAELPAWVDPSWHHCLIGCMKCQSACPENKAFLGWFDDRDEFAENETQLLVKRTSFDQLPDETAAKRRSLQLNEDYRILCRNLSLLID